MVWKSSKILQVGNTDTKRPKLILTKCYLQHKFGRRQRETLISGLGPTLKSLRYLPEIFLSQYFAKFVIHVH